VYCATEDRDLGVREVAGSGRATGRAKAWKLDQVSIPDHRGATSELEKSREARVGRGDACERAKDWGKAIAELGLACERMLLSRRASIAAPVLVLCVQLTAVALVGISKPPGTWTGEVDLAFAARSALAFRPLRRDLVQQQ
jgi:hypothetical protein